MSQPGLIPSVRDLAGRARRRTAGAVHRRGPGAPSPFGAGIDLAADLADSLTPEEVVQRLLRRAVETVDADHGSLCRVEEDRLIVEAAYGRRGDLRRSRRAYPLSAYPLAGEVIRSRRPVRSGGTGRDPVPPPLHETPDGFCHAVVLPLTGNDQVVGVGMVCRPGDIPFDDQDISVLALIGGVAAITLRNSTLLVQAQEAARTQSSYLKTAAHELRTPVTVIRGYLSVLLDGSLGVPPQRWEHPLRIIADKSEELGDLVEELLVASRLDAGRMAGAAEPLDLRGAVRRAIDRAAGRAEILGAYLECDLPEEPVVAVADSGQVGHVLDNLINNALSYSREAPWVSISVTVEGAEARVLVADHGVGIPDDARDRVFERFERLQDTSISPRSGTGLGLPIARELAERNSGSLVIESSEPESGSRFLLTLPLAQLPAPA